MMSIGIDLGGRKSQICVMNRGEVEDEFAIATRDIGAWLQKQRPSRVLMESCSESRAVALQAQGFGHDTYVTPSAMAPELGVGKRHQKNDLLDARALARYGCVIDNPIRVHLKSTWSRDVLELLATRRKLVGVRGDFVRRIKSTMRERLMPAMPRFSKYFTNKARAQLTAHELGMSLALELTLDQVDSLSVAIQRCDDEILERASACDVASRLMTVPGVGAQIALWFIAIVDDPTRFEGPENLANYLGLTPGESSSGSRKRFTGITKAGPVVLRSLLIQAAWSQWRCRANDPLPQWAQRLTTRRGNKLVAVAAMARKLASLMLAIWKNGSSFDPTRIVSQTP